ncbi:VOC family protein [Labrys monachus]|uniref:Enzyme related to lactoylglutathione lyase n=1 Tax=Labrys monachus TaxID=217067 RepID=A0ABU0FFP0_9HYPH|nr:VOC family protein [Labrys monachus]MDQ0393152.1 putative enzyme related to lactoylglutathione lyase [Labrys monachus]
MKILDQSFRVYAAAEALEPTIAFYEQLQGVPCARRVTITETNVVAARVGNVLILAGDGEAMTAARQVHGIFYVDDLDAYAGWVREQGGTLLHEPRTVTSGRNFTARHPDGLIIEYFEARS